MYLAKTLVWMATATATANLCCVGQQEARIPPDSHVLILHDQSFDYVVNNGLETPADRRVDKNIDEPSTFFMSDELRWNWSNQHMSELQATQEILRGKEVTSMHPMVLPGLLEFRVSTNDGKTVTLEQWIVDHASGFMVVYNSRSNGPLVALEAYNNGLAPEIRHHWYSATKNAVGISAWIAMKEHKVLRERLITELLPIFKGSGFEGATLGHVLDQTTGVEFVDSRYAQNDVMSLVAAITAQDKANGFVTSSNGSKDAVGELNFVMKLPKTHDHGAYFNYGNVNPAVAIAVVEQLYDNKSFAEIFAEKVWSRIGAEQNAYVLVDHTGFALGAAGMGSTLRDFARWGLAHLPSSNSEAIPREFIDDLLADHEFRVDLKRGSPFRFDPNWHFLSESGNYRNLYTVLYDGKKTALLPTGHGAQICAVYPQFDVVVAQFASQLNPEPTTKQHYATMAIVAEYVATQYRNQGL